MCCMRLAGNTGRKNDAKNRRLRTISQLCRAVSSQLRHVSTIGKKVKQQYLPHTTCHHTMVNFGSLTAEIGSLFWGTPANFNGLCILPSLLQRCRLAEVNQTLHDVWPSPRLVYDIYLGLLSAVGILLGAKNRFTSNSCVLLLTYCSVTARHFSSGRQPNFTALNRGRHLYSAGRPSRWALAHILVPSFFPCLISAVGDWMSTILLHMAWP